MSRQTLRPNGEVEMSDSSTGGGADELLISALADIVGENDQAIAALVAMRTFLIELKECEEKRWAEMRKTLPDTLLSYMPDWLPEPEPQKGETAPDADSGDLS